jgi:hypothetical protein
MSAEAVREPVAGPAVREVSPAKEGWWVLGVALALFAGALVIRLFSAQRQDIWADELYHLIAGNSLRAGRGFQLYEGAYARAPQFTWIISKLTPYFTWNLLVPRLPAAIAGALQVALVFAWLRARAGWIAAFAAAAFLCLAHVAVEQSSYVRFYSVLALLVWLTTTAAYDVVYAPGRGRRLLALAVAVASAVVAMRLQSITLIALAGIALWGGWTLLTTPSVSRRTKVLVFAGAGLAVAAGALLVALKPEMFSHAFYEATKSEQWNKASKGDVLYYVRYLLGEYPLLMSGFLLATFLAYRERASLTVLCLCVTGVACALLSIAGAKTPRYILFALPFIFTVWGLGLAGGWKLLAGSMAPLDRRKRSWLALAGVTLVAVLSASPGFAITITSSLGGLKRAVQARSLLFAAPGDEPWQSRRAEIAQALSNRSVVVTTDEFRTLRYFGAFDVALVPSYNAKGGKKDFTPDRRTGRPDISTEKNFELVYSCYPTGALLVFADKWPAPVEVDPEVQTFLDQYTRHQVFSAESTAFQVHILSWSHAAAPPSPECAALKQTISRGHSPASETIGRVAAEPDGGRISFRR